MNQEIIRAQFNEEMSKFQKIMDEIRLLKAASADLKKFRKMMPHKKYD